MKSDKKETKILGLLHQLFWPGGDPAFPDDAARHKRRPPPVERGERRTKSMGREHHRGFGWDTIILAIAVLAVAVAAMIPTGVLDRILHGPPGIVPSKPYVLVVSARQSDQLAAAGTLQPRGYIVLLADNAAVGLEDLQRQPQRIGALVIDGDIPGAGRLIGRLKTVCPEARLIVLSGPRDAGRVSNLLVDSVIQ